MSLFFKDNVPQPVNELKTMNIIISEHIRIKPEVHC